MAEKLKKELLKDELELLDKAVQVLKKSYDNCSRISSKKEYDERELIEFEALCSRFGRASDILFQKILRLVDELDLEPGGSVRDRINRAAKKGLADDAGVLISMRELRNDIAHEYLPENIKFLCDDVLKACPELFSIVEKVKAYCTKF